MKKSDIYEIAIRILGLYLITILITQFRDVLMFASIVIQNPNHSEQPGEIDQWPIFIITIASFILLSIFAALLIFKAKDITNRICRKEDMEVETGAGMERKTIYEIALTLLGLITIVQALPEFLFKFRQHLQLIQGGQANRDGEIQLLVILGLKLVIGVLSVVYAKAISVSLGKK
ncbi:hypothetical protein SAMN03003324_03003 [Pedobacter antarcticus]|uniref:Uncharacterized protein n=2 Tax=Pedobacter antarcticus TaxID=34086 RepID=A0A1I2H6Y6_9SPHI|nr:hypothetical protein [Pedobacter antarcticus]SFF25123.1 hypothetical protein SAMN03003324_03003 [Pedobacter antarcticus]